MTPARGKPQTKEHLWQLSCALLNCCHAPKLPGLESPRAAASLSQLQSQVQWHKALCPCPCTPSRVPTDLAVALVRLPAPEVVAEQQRPQLPVLVFDVILHSSLARAAQLVGLLQVVPVHLNLLIVLALVREREGESR